MSLEAKPAVPLSEREREREREIPLDALVLKYISCQKFHDEPLLVLCFDGCFSIVVFIAEFSDCCCVQETFEGDERFWFETMMVVIESALSTESKKHRDRYTEVLTTFNSRQRNLWQR